MFSKKLIISNCIEVSDGAASEQVKEGEEEEEEAGPNQCDGHVGAALIEFSEIQYFSRSSSCESR